MKPITIQHNGKTVTIANEAQRDVMVGDMVAEKVKSGMAFEPAWSEVQNQHPELFAGMKHPKITMPHQPGRASFTNAMESPVFDARWKSIFRLPQSTDQATCAAAWDANGGQASAINFKKVFDGLVQFVGKQRGLDSAAAQNAVKSEFPDVWAAVQLIQEAK